MRYSILAAGALAICGAAQAQPTSDLTLPPGFHASIVADGLGSIRHLAFSRDGNLYVSTNVKKGGALPQNVYIATDQSKAPASTGIIAIHLNAQHVADKVVHFGDVVNGTGLRVHGDYLYASSPGAVYRFVLHEGALVPGAAPQTVVTGIPDEGFPNRMLALDDSGHLFVSVGGVSNICIPADTPKDAVPVGLRPCPALANRAGIWRFAAGKTDQDFARDGTRIATGLRDSDSLDWAGPQEGLYVVMHGRNGTSDTWPGLKKFGGESSVSEEMHQVKDGANFGWPYTYYDGPRDRRLVAPEYGGDGNKVTDERIYDKPAMTFPAHSAPLDLAFYHGSMFPAPYRNGAFVALHGGSGPDLADGHNGYEVDFVPFGGTGKPGAPTAFATGFAGPLASDRNVSKAAYRPAGLAIGPDGALYIADSEKGRIWRISYGE